MNLKVLDSYINKLCLVFLLCFLLIGCQKPKYYLDLYYAKTCPVCQSFIKNVIPHIEDKYGKTIQITYYDIDEEASRDAYAKTCSLLEDYYVDEDSGSIPFIVLDGYFAKVGYNVTEKEDILDAIDEAIQGQEISKELTEFYYFQEGQTFH